MGWNKGTVELLGKIWGLRYKSAKKDNIFNIKIHETSEVIAPFIAVKIEIAPVKSLLPLSALSSCVVCVL